MTEQPARAMDSYGSEDMAIPELKLVQSVGGAEAKAAGAQPGNFYCTITGEIIPGADGLDIIVVDIRKNRTFWGRTEIEDEPPICASMDARYNMEGVSCDLCPEDARCDTPWLLDAAARRGKCLLNYTVLCIDYRNQLPMLIRASGISTQAVRELMTQLRMNKQLKGEYHRAIVHVTSQPKKTASGEAFAMTLRASKIIQDVQLIEDLKHQSRGLLGTAVMLPEGVQAEAPEAELSPETAPATTSAPDQRHLNAPKSKEPLVAEKKTSEQLFEELPHAEAGKGIPASKKAEEVDPGADPNAGVEEPPPDVNF